MQTAPPESESHSALPSTRPGTWEKAFQINLDPSTYGTFAEIGAGQEVARWFFRAGGASRTVAKTISAYDMAVSSAIYGKVRRYVTRERLQQMLEREFHDLQSELATDRGEKTRFFAFANTVAAQSHQRREECDGWMGIRFQHAFGAPASDVVVHVRLLDPDNLPQQEALGIVGVNLVDAALRWNGDLRGFLASLADDLGAGRIEVDMVSLSGPAFTGVDNRIASLLLVELGLSSACLFSPEGEVFQASEVFYDKDVLIDRGTFRPPTQATQDRLEGGRARFIHDLDGQAGRLQVVAEMTLREVADSGVIDYRDYLERVDLLGSSGQWVLVSRFLPYHRLATFISRYTRRRAGLVLNVTNLRHIYDESAYHYSDFWSFSPSPGGGAA